MDGVSAASAVLQILAASGSLIAKTTVFIQNAKQVDETTNNLFEQVHTLRRTVQVVRTVLEGWQTQLGDWPLAQEEAEALEKMKTTLEATSGTVQWLETKVESLGGGKSEPNWFKKGWAQLKYQLQVPAIDMAQKQIETSIVSLMLMLKCATRYEKMRTVKPVVHESDQILASIQETMNQLKTLIERSLPAASSNTPNDEDGLIFQDESLNIDKITGETLSLAAECLTVAESVCGKISRIPESTTEDTDAPDSDSDEETEPLDVLTGHIDNNYRMALWALQREDFGKAENYILQAITNAELRDSTYGFPFEDRLCFTEIHAFVLSKQKRFSDAAVEYESLITSARGVPHNYENKGRLYYSLALMHRDKYYSNHLGEKNDALFDAWKKNGVPAFKNAKKYQRGRRGSLPADEPWKACPSLNQAAELLYDMYVRWDRPGEASTYKSYLRRSEIAHPSTTLIRGNSPDQRTLPTPPPSVESDSEPPASRGIFAMIHSNNYNATKSFLASAESSFHIDQINEDGLTPLLLAVQKGLTKIVGLLLENSPKPDIKAKGRSGWTVLHYALWGPGRDEMLELLLQHGADIHASTKEGKPLHFAAAHNNVRAAKKLIKQNAALEAKDDAKRTPIMRAALEKKYDMVKLLLDEGALLDPSQFESKPDIDKFVRSILNSRRGSVGSRGSTSTSTSTSSGLQLSRILGRSRNT